MEIQNWNHVAVHENVTRGGGRNPARAHPASREWFPQQPGEVQIENRPGSPTGPPHLTVAEDGPPAPTPFGRGRRGEAGRERDIRDPREARDPKRRMSRVMHRDSCGIFRGASFEHTPLRRARSYASTRMA